MLNKKEKIEVTDVETVMSELKKTNSLLERLVICQEKKLSGEVIKNFDSKKHITKEV